MFGPKSLYSLLAICSLPSLELRVANIIQDTIATKTAISSQSILSEPGAREMGGKTSVSRGDDLTILCLHRGQVNKAIAMMKKQRLPQKSGTNERANANAVR